MFSIRYLFAVAFAFGSCTLQTFAADPRPNIVLIMADDMGFSDLGCYGGEIETPHIDALAADGLRFSQFYNGARCCPTRAALLTGLYAHQTGVGHMINDRGDPAYQGFLNDRCLTLAEMLDPAGYRTLMSGKWHVGEQTGQWPVDRGFERYFGLISGASNYFRVSSGRKMALGNEPYAPPTEGFYMTDAFVDYALQFLDECGGGDEPFFLYLPFTSPHWPLHAHDEDVAKFRGRYQLGWDAVRQGRLQRTIAEGLIDPVWNLTERDERVPAWEEVPAADRDEWDLRMAVYAAQIHCMDRNIGRVAAKLEELGKRRNTLIMFLCDNGGCAEIIDRGEPDVAAGKADSYLSYGVGWANASNTPFRRYKHWVHEGGIATPLVVSWPAGLQAKGVVHDVAHIIDVAATCIDLAGADYPAERGGKSIHPLAGVSLSGVFRGEALAREVPLFWEHEGNRAVRDGDWKLVARHGQPLELYNLQADRTETQNLIDDQPERAKRLANAWQTWAGQVGVRPWDEIRQRR